MQLFFDRMPSLLVLDPRTLSADLKNAFQIFEIRKGSLDGMISSLHRIFDVIHGISVHEDL